MINNKNKFRNSTIILICFILITSCDDLLKQIPSAEQYYFNKQGKLIEKIDQEGQKTKYKYDEKDQLTEIKYSGGYVKYAYDQIGNIKWMEDNTGMTIYFYDALNRLNGVIWRHSPLRLIKYDYNSRSLLKSIEIYNISIVEQEQKYSDFFRKLESSLKQEDQKWIEMEFEYKNLIHLLENEDLNKKNLLLEYDVNYDYDLLGNIKNVSTNGLTINYSYDYDNNIMERRLPKGIKSVFRYNPSGFLESLAHFNQDDQLIVEYSYEYNYAGKVEKALEISPDGSKNITRYKWDSQGYLKELQLSDGKIFTYQYDELGNRTVQFDGEANLDYIYDNYGRLHQAGGMTFKWDKTGSLAKQIDEINVAKFNYNGRNLPTSVRINNEIMNFIWDGNGNLITKQFENQTAHYLPDPISPGVTLAEYDSKNNLSKSFIYADVLIAHYDSDGQLQYYLEDGFNSIRKITYVNGNIIGQQDFTPFGKPYNIEGDISTDFRTTGERFIPEINSFIIQDRVYNPTTGRYSTSNPQSGDIFKFDKFNDHAHACNASGIYMEPRCNQTSKKWYQKLVINCINFWRELETDYWEAWPIVIDKMRSPGLYVPGYTIEPGQFVLGPVLIDGWVVSKPPMIDANIVWWESPHKTLKEIRWSLREDVPANAKIVGATGSWGPDGEPPPAEGIAAKLYNLPETNIGILDPATYRENYQKQQFQNRKLDNKTNLEEELISRTDLSDPNDTRKIYKGPDWPDDKDRGGGGGLGGGNLDQFLSGNFMDPFKSYEDQLGGIELSSTAEFIGNLGRLVGAVYDPEKECLVLIGDNDLSLPAIKPEDLAIALLLALKTNPHDPAFSLDPANPNNPYGEWLKAVYIPEEILEGTYFGKAMFEADWLLKQYAFGVYVDQNGKIFDRKSSVPGFKSHADILFDKNNISDYKRENWNRFWLVSDEMKLRKNKNGLYYDVAKIRVKTRKQIPDPTSPTGLRDVDSDDPDAKIFADLFTKLYDEIAVESPEFGRIKELAKAVALAKWLRELNIPIDLNWVNEFANKKINTITKINSLSLTKQKKHSEPYADEKGQGTMIYTNELHLFGGVDLTVKPEYKTDDGTVQYLENEVLSFLNQGDPIFNIEFNGKNLQAIVMPITKGGQKLWKDADVIKTNGTIYQFDDNKNIVKSIDNDGNESYYSYDVNGNLNTIKIVNKNGWSAYGERKNDLSNWKIKSRKGYLYQYQYNMNGYLENIEIDGQTYASVSFDPNELKTIIHYDDYRELISYDINSMITNYELQTIEDNNGEKSITQNIKYEYDNVGNLIKIDGTGALKLSMSYDKDNNPVKISSPAGQSEILYGPDGRVDKIINSEGYFVEYDYNSLNRVSNNQNLKVLVNINEKEAEYIIGINGIIREKNLLGGSVNYYYDEKGNLTSVENSQLGKAEYSYDESNNINEIILPNGCRIEYRSGKHKKINYSKLDHEEVEILSIITHPIK